MLTLGAFAFAAPWVLLALLSLPVIWWLLRVTPPAPKLIRFPAIRLLFRLPQREETPAHTPLWLLILRLVLATLVIVALAHPLHNPAGGAATGGPLVLTIDNGWGAAQGWQQRQDYLADLLDQAERERRNVVVLATAPPATGDAVRTSRLMRAGEAREIVQALKPLPWPSEFEAAARAAAAIKLNGEASVVWLSDGLAAKGTGALAEALGKLGPVTLVTERVTRLPLVLRPPGYRNGRLAARVERGDAGPARAAQIRALDEKGAVLGMATALFKAGERAAEVEIDLPSELRNRIARLDLAGQSHAGAVVLVDERWRRRPVGMVGERTIGTGQPLLSEQYYLDRALGPYTELRHGALADLLSRPLAVMILPDASPIAEGDKGRLVAWIESGGLLLRFAGARLAEGNDDLVPVKLRRGGRAVGGAMTWTQPLGLAAFPERSPFAGLPVPSDVRVSQQVLAEPAADLAAKTWARLSDGTPLVTAERRGRGWIVLIHTTASPEWSNLPLSGLFVEMLRRMVALSEGVAAAEADIQLPPRETIDGFGRPAQPPATAIAIAAKDFARTHPGPRHPPGLYGTDTIRRTLNLSPSLPRPAALAIPAGASQVFFDEARQTDLKPWLLAAAVALLIIDILIGLAMRGLIPLPQRAATAGALLAAAALSALVLFAAPPAFAQTGSGGAIDEEFAVKATLETRLAYVATGNPEIDRVSLAAMRGLGAILNRRTSIEPGEPMAVDPDSQELVFFPLVYWPIAPGQAPLSRTAAERINGYLRTGGVLLIDLRDQTGQGLDAIELRRMIGDVSIPALIPVPRDHVLTKSFYLLQNFPGRFAGGTTWIVQRESTVNDGVSPVILGTSDWGGAWAVDENLRPMFPVIPGGEAQRELAYRSGINIVMFAMTGNYKGDQVHLPTIMRRLGQ